MVHQTILRDDILCGTSRFCVPASPPGLLTLWYLINDSSHPRRLDLICHDDHAPARAHSVCTRLRVIVEKLVSVLNFRDLATSSCAETEFVLTVMSLAWVFACISILSSIRC
ncbi:hypothetical protein GGX14DRAFT_161 [Mycena pura]|uniref:Uncharacterized protein n=1 Tax=Mycena pura TaxID=153505 RepID=A0AAD6YUE1_9AGAR|nr:hypothetical protein GGX14DRAFT_161 [Mycena pura]